MAQHHDPAVAHFERGIEPVDVLPHSFGSQTRQTVERSRSLESHLRCEIGRAQRKTIGDEPAIAARCAPGETLGFDQDDALAAAAQFMRGS